jgi:hypothetical protein
MPKYSDGVKAVLGRLERERLATKTGIRDLAAKQYPMGAWNDEGGLISRAVWIASQRSSLNTLKQEMRLLESGIAEFKAALARVKELEIFIAGEAWREAMRRGTPEQVEKLTTFLIEKEAPDA